MGKLQKASKNWESSGANNSADKPLADGQHNRNFDPSKSAERTNMSSKLNGDSSKYRGNAGTGSGGNVGSSLNADSAKYRGK